jgi:hypothetical protein
MTGWRERGYLHGLEGREVGQLAHPLVGSYIVSHEDAYYVLSNIYIHIYLYIYRERSDNQAATTTATLIIIIFAHIEHTLEASSSSSIIIIIPLLCCRQEVGRCLTSLKTKYSMAGLE